jgi:[ribosomal protein S5]-alanine N-acetyltransferase
MERMPYFGTAGTNPAEAGSHIATRANPADAGFPDAFPGRDLRSETVSSDWQRALPVLTGAMVRLRELRLSDAVSLLALLTTEEVARFVAPPPSTVEEFERFISWSHRQRAAGTYACFAVTLSGSDTAIGIFQIRQQQPRFESAEWGFAIGAPYWGTGVFPDAARVVLAFAFDTLEVHRLEARVAVPNGRGNGALRKVGAIAEAVLHGAFLRNGRYFDQLLYTIVDNEWREADAGRRQVPRTMVQ